MNKQTSDKDIAKTNKDSLASSLSDRSINYRSYVFFYFLFNNNKNLVKF